MIESDFRRIVLAHQDRVYNTCLGFVKHEEEAEDIAQEVFIQVYQSYDTFLQKSELSTWIYKITVNKCLESIRKSKAKRRAGNETNTELKDYMLISHVHPGIQLENKERASILFGAIAKLPESQQVAYTLNKIEGLSYDEIGKVTGKSKSSIESLLHRAKQSLQKLLKTYYEES
ncbi:MAG: RNA polymerase sigma factor [Cyclobacteriaceae bacterium]